MATWFPIPSTLDGLHPQVIHFPIALLLVAPVFIFLGLARPRNQCGFSLTALILIALGTVAAWVSVASGEAAGQLVDQSTPELAAALEGHAKMAENARLAFTILSVVFAGLVAAPRLWKTIKPRLLFGLHFAFLLIFLLCCLLVVRTGHLGGVLVHNYGVQAMLDDAGAPAPGAETETVSE